MSRYFCPEKTDSTSKVWFTARPFGGRNTPMIVTYPVVRLTPFHSYFLSLIYPSNHRQAEEEFLQAGKPREAIDMFVHQKAWADACRVAEGHDPPAVSDVLCAQAADVGAAGDRAAAEELFVRAAKPEKALQVDHCIQLLQCVHAFACRVFLSRGRKGDQEARSTGGEGQIQQSFLFFLVHGMPQGWNDSSCSDACADARPTLFALLRFRTETLESLFPF